MNLIKIIEKYIFPQALYCISCGAIIDSSRTYMLCDECMENFKWNTGATCHTCGKALGPVLSSAIEAGVYVRNKQGKFLCYDCMKYNHFFTRGYSALSYGKLEKEAVLGLKHGCKGYLAKPLGEIVADKLAEVIKEEYDGAIPWDIIVPVPIHISRMVLRGYNQTELVGREVAERIGIPMCKDALIRVRNTTSSRGKDKYSRTSNLENAFAVNKEYEKHDKLYGKTVLLVDDIYTTGATADACAKELLRAGVNEVHVAVIATGSNYNSGSN